jgi:hypothetical protein
LTRSAECDLNMDSFQEQPIVRQGLNHHLPPMIH